MNRKLGMTGSLVNSACVLGFAVCMLCGTDFGSYVASMFIAFSFVLMIGAFAQECSPERKAAGNAAMIFAGVYAAIILLVYFAQTTAVLLDGLNEQAMRILDFRRFGLFFSYDLLGYALMALATFFTGLGMTVKSKPDRWLRVLLLIHGVFFVSCLLLPMLGVFSAEPEGADWIGVAVLEFWCLYFIPVGLLSFRHFKCSGE